MKSPVFKKMNQSKRFPWRYAFCLCFVPTHCLNIFIYKDLAVIYLGSTMRANQIALNAVSLVVSL